MPDQPDYLKIATEAARAAGAVLAEGADLRTVNFQDAKDVKLKADVESEKLIRRMLGEATGLPIIGEEQGGDESLPTKDELYWVVDPLDGTYNYLRGLPACCVSIGLMRGMEPEVGVVYDFNADELFAGAAGWGLTCNGKPLTPWWPELKEHAVLCTGFPHGRDYGDTALRAFVKDVQSFQKIRMVGSAALALTYVAIGRMDVYTEDTIRLWDIAGGMALAAASGATISVTPSKNNKPFAYNVWVGGRKEWLPG
ncbi:inositol monophosphatase family protein [Cerasicoccus fimbriatus]|uniref:inositol monophosphatase family protein n=1 Tax=Cerasicoccus fimbriatus TaxID=3014554 RepID=UPI0022B38FB2|nr:inositol monophosphatase family protein [Cerasicoccus sp. TK19100]